MGKLERAISTMAVCAIVAVMSEINIYCSSVVLVICMMIIWKK
jgi:hypothetical protein